MTPRRPRTMSSLGEGRDRLFQRVTKSFLRSVTNDPLSSITFLDLSSCGLKRITGLAACPNIEIVIASNNEIDTLMDLSGCRQLWKLDVSCNELKDLCGFQKFTTFGTLIASCNQLNWMELVKISHLEVLSLFLTGNDNLERDTNYRKHIIKCLPKIWSLDGELVTSEERCEVNWFFEKTSYTKRPVRVKVPCHHFVPSFRKQGCSSNIHGRRTADQCKYFGRNEVHNKMLDHRRLQYLYKNFHTDLVLESWNELAYDFLQGCLKMRDESVERWNMFVLLLISSLVFSIPKALMALALQVIGMTDAELATCNDILQLPCQLRTNLISLFFSFTKLQGLGQGITSKLYATMRYMNISLIKVAYGDTDIEIEVKHQHTLAAEIVQIFCLVPQLSSYLSDENVTKILISATLNNNIENEARQILSKSDVNQAKENLVEFITLKIQEAKETSYNDESWSQTRQQSSLGFAPSCNGINDVKVSSRARPSTAPPLLARFKHEKPPSVGDRVLLGPQRLGHIVSKPDVKVVLVQIDSLSSSKFLQADYIEPTDNQHSLFYVRKEDLEWDVRFNAWMLNSSYQPSVIPNEIEKSDLFPKNLDTRYLALCKEPNHIQKRSKATAATSKKEPMVISGFRSTRFSPKSKEIMKQSQRRKSHQKQNDGEQESDDDCLNVMQMGLKTEDVDDKYLPVFESNAFHLYYLDKAQYITPTTKYSTLPRVLNVGRSSKNFIRKSNWMEPLT